MEKLVSICFVFVLLMSVAVSALASPTPAGQMGEADWFEIYVQCKNANTYEPAKPWDYKEESNKAIYVRHFVNGGSSDYTNHFRAQRVDSLNESRYTVGSKWCTVGLNVPIQGNSIVANRYYSIAGRGNTNHYDYDGVSNVTLQGYMYLHSNVTP